MSPAVGEAGNGLETWSMSVRAGEGSGVMREVMTRAAKEGAEVLVLDGSMVFGKDHLRSAAFHAARAIEQGTNSSDSMAMETLLYASGERQLNAAIKKMSISEMTTEVVVCRLGEGGFDPGQGWATVPGRVAVLDRERLLRFGVTAEELRTVDHEDALELVLEKVAAVDILKR